MRSFVSPKPILTYAALPFALVALAFSMSNAKPSGVFTAAQAKSGATEYAANCLRCHGANLQGVSAPALTGAASGLKGDSVSDAYTFISNQMPAGNPGSLTTKQYLDIVSYILMRNGHHPGSAKLTVTSAKHDKTTHV